MQDAIQYEGEYLGYYNEMRLHSAIGYIAPADKLNGRDAGIFAERDRKIEEARQKRKDKRYERYEQEGGLCSPLTYAA